MATQSGFLLLADISGYTSFVTQTELEHAEEILTSLIEEIVGQTRAPLKVLELEGDAVFSYAPEGGFSGRQTLVDMIEQMYVAFARRRTSTTTPPVPAPPANSRRRSTSSSSFISGSSPFARSAGTRA